MMTAVRVKRSNRHDMREYLNGQRLRYNEFKDLFSTEFVVSCPTDSHMYAVERFARSL